jgi:hypothetical protein
MSVERSVFDVNLRPSVSAAVLPHNEVVHVADGTFCPCRCGRTIRPTDFEVFDGVVRSICPNSGIEIFSIFLVGSW